MASRKNLNFDSSESDTEDSNTRKPVPSTDDEAGACALPGSSQVNGHAKEFEDIFYLSSDLEGSPKKLAEILPPKHLRRAVSLRNTNPRRRRRHNRKNRGRSEPSSPGVHTFTTEELDALIKKTKVYKDSIKRSMDDGRQPPDRPPSMAHVLMNDAKMPCPEEPEPGLQELTETTADEDRDPCECSPPENTQQDVQQEAQPSTSGVSKPKGDPKPDSKTPGDSDKKPRKCDRKPRNVDYTDASIREMLAQYESNLNISVSQYLDKLSDKKPEDVPSEGDESIPNEPAVQLHTEQLLRITIEQEIAMKLMELVRKKEDKLEEEILMKLILSCINENLAMINSILKIFRDMWKLLASQQQSTHSESDLDSIRDYFNKGDVLRMEYFVKQNIEGINREKKIISMVKELLKEGDNEVVATPEAASVEPEATSVEPEATSVEPEATSVEQEAANSEERAHIIDNIKIIINEILSNSNILRSAEDVPNIISLHGYRLKAYQNVRNARLAFFISDLLYAQNYMALGKLLCDNLYIIKGITFSSAKIRGIITKITVTESECKLVLDDGTGCIACIIDQGKIIENASDYPIITFLASDPVRYESIENVLGLKVGDVVHARGKLYGYVNKRYFCIEHLCKEDSSLSADRECRYIHYVRRVKILYEQIARKYI